MIGVIYLPYIRLLLNIIKGIKMPVIVENDFDFYKASKHVRYGLIGTYFVYEGMEYCRYYPIKLTKEGSYYNYNKLEGIMYLSDNTNRLSYIKGKHIKVGTTTIDDGWDSIGFYNPTDDFEKISAFIMKMNKFNVTYREIFEAIHKEFGGNPDF